MEIFPFGELGDGFFEDGEPLADERAGRFDGIKVLELEDYLVTSRAIRVENVKKRTVAEEFLAGVESVRSIAVDSGS